MRGRKVHGAGQLHERYQSRANARGAFASEEDLDPFSRAFLVRWGGVEYSPVLTYCRVPNA